MSTVTGTTAGTAPREAAGPVPFPSADWFQRLADMMNASRARQEQLGYVDCVAGFRVLDETAASARTFEVTFEEFSATAVREAGATDGCADFVLEASHATWKDLIENIAQGNGRPDLTHTLNYLSHRGTPIRLVADDPLKSDLYFRYNQSLQEFINASAALPTVFPAT